MNVTAIRELIASGGPDIVFQSIHRLHGRPVVEGYEALSRFPDGIAPDLWFKAACSEGLGLELERAAMAAAITRFRHALGGFRAELGYLALNISPKALVDADTREFLTRADNDMPIHLVLELSESQVVSDYEAVLAAVEELRRVGVALSIDDLGAGFSSLQHVYRLHPEHVKIDRSLVTEVDTDPYQIALVSAVVGMARAMGAAVIAEGVERGEQADSLRILGVTSGQGWFFSRPGALR